MIMQEGAGRQMGVYLNSKAAYTLYKSETEKPYFVDKSSMLEDATHMSHILSELRQGLCEI